MLHLKHRRHDHRSVVVLGVGNPLLGDDGVGVHLAQQLQGDPDGLPQLTTVMDGGTFGEDFAGRLSQVDRVVIVDAVPHGMPPGTVGTWHGEQVTRIFRTPLTFAEAAVAQLLASLKALGHLAPEVVVVGVEPGSLLPGSGLSAAVALAVPEMRHLVNAAAHGF